MTGPPLVDLRLVDLAGGLAAGYCAKLFTDAGADVIVVEPPGGDSLRRWSVDGRDLGEADGALFRFLRHGQRSMVGALGDAEIDDLVASADVVVVGAQQASVAHDLAAGQPGLVVLSLTPYGLTGPYADRPATEFTIQADVGAVAIRGRPDQTPFQSGGRVGEWLNGIFGTVTVLAACRRSAATGRGELIDLSAAEVHNLTSTTFTDLADWLRGRPRPDRPARNLETPSIEPTADGYVGFNTNTRQQFDDFCILIDRPDLAADGTFAMLSARFERWDEWNRIVHGWTRQHTTEAIVELASAFRIPVAPVCNGATVAEQEQFRERGTFGRDPSGEFVMPRRPWTIDNDPAPPPLPAPTPGRHQCTIEARTRRADTSAPAASANATMLPLAGIRVLDATAWWAGPTATYALAALGAEVVHVESVAKPDGMRMVGGAFHGQPDWWERSWFFLNANANKSGLTLDLGRDEGRDVFLRLVAGADVVVENFTPRVLENFDLAWDVIHATNPGTVMVRMPAFGLDGPWRDRPGFAQTMEQLTGLAWMTGHPEDQPRIQRGPCDPNAGMHAAFAILCALEQRDRSGEGCLVEVPMIEAALNIAAEQVIEHSAYGTLLQREGNRSPFAAPQNLYACAGHEERLALAVETDEQWDALRGVLGDPGWAQAAALTAHHGRRAAHDLLDRHIGAWAADRSVDDAVAVLVAAGVPAAPARDPRRTSEHPQFVHRGFTERVEHPVVGAAPLIGLPFRFASIDRWNRSPAPLLGQHNRELLQGIGCTDADLDHLESEGIIGTRPTGF